VQVKRTEARALGVDAAKPTESGMRTLADVFEHTLQDIEYAEHAISKALPKVIAAVVNADLKSAI
jgi:Domain of unknown function (DUF892)